MTSCYAVGRRASYILPRSAPANHCSPVALLVHFLRPGHRFIPTCWRPALQIAKILGHPHEVRAGIQGRAVGVFEEIADLFS